MLRSAHVQDTDTTASLLLIEFYAFLRYNIVCAQVLQRHTVLLYSYRRLQTCTTQVVKDTHQAHL